MKFSDTEKAVFRHYYRKLKKQTRGGKLHRDIGGYLPGDMMAKYNRMGLLWRGTHKGELETIADKGKFVSAWTSGAFPKKPRTYVAGGPELTKNYALTAAAFTGDRSALQAARFGHHTGKNLTETVKDARIYAIAPSALKRSDNKIRSHIGSYADTAPLRGGIFRSEVRGILKPTLDGKNVRWRPTSLGDVQNRNFSAKLGLRELARGDYAIPALGKMLRDRSFLEEFMTGKRGPKLGDLASTHYGVGRIMNKNKYLPSSPLEKITNIIRGKPKPVAVPNVEEYALMRARNDRNARSTVAKIIRKGRAGGDVYEELNLSAKLRLREFVRVMGGADIPASMSQIRSAWRTFKNAAPGKIVRSTTQGSSFGPRGMVVQKAAAGAKIDREALLAGATNTTNYPITSALHEGGHALFNKAMTGSANQQFLPRLGRGPTPEKHPLRGVQIMANEIGANNSAVQVLRGAGVKQDAVSDFLKFRQRGIDSHMRSAREHVAAAPVGLTPQRHQEIKGAFNRWITDWKRSAASPNAKLSVDAPELVKKDFESAKLRLRELARGDYAIPALGKMLKDRSFLEEFLTGKRGPKLGDLHSEYLGKIGREGGVLPQESLQKTIRLPASQERPVIETRRRRYGNLLPWQFPPTAASDKVWIQHGGATKEQFRAGRQQVRDTVAKMIRKGRAGGDVYEEINRS